MQCTVHCIADYFNISWEYPTQELENVREENKTMLKQVSDMKKEQSELVNLVLQMKDVLDKKQGQNTTRKETGEENN